MAAVIPTYRAAGSIVAVVRDALKYFQEIVVVDDSCPESSGELVKRTFGTNKKVRVLKTEKNLGVGGATKLGLRSFSPDPHLIIVKIDADGQMNLEYLDELVDPIMHESASISKGNRFSSLEHLQGMPPVRLFGNSILTLMNRFSSGLWEISDPTNGYVAFKATSLGKLSLDKVSNDFQFESDILFRASIAGLKVADVPIPALYGEERSNLKPIKVAPKLAFGYAKNYLKRIFYQYFLYSISPGTLYLVGGLILSVFGAIFGLERWINSANTGEIATAGTVSLVIVSLVMGLQLLLQFMSFDTNGKK